MIALLLLLFALDVPMFQSSYIKNQHVALSWSHPDCYMFEIRRVVDGGNATTNTLFINGAKKQKKHEFQWKTKLTGATNVFTIRAVNEEQPDQKSNWSETLTVIP